MHDTGPMLGSCLAVAFVVIAVASVAWHLSRSRDVLDSWAAQNGYRILSRERRQLRAGPYFVRRAKGQEVFYVTVADATGRQRSGHVRVGGLFLGLLSDATDVTWDEER